MSKKIKIVKNVKPNSSPEIVEYTKEAIEVVIALTEKKLANKAKVESELKKLKSIQNQCDNGLLNNDELTKFAKSNLEKEISKLKKVLNDIEKYENELNTLKTLKNSF